VLRTAPKKKREVRGEKGASCRGKAPRDNRVRGNCPRIEGTMKLEKKKQWSKKREEGKKDSKFDVGRDTK